MEAAYCDCTDILKLLLANGAKVDLRDKDGSRLKFRFFRMFGLLLFVVVYILPHASRIGFERTVVRDL